MGWRTEWDVKVQLSFRRRVKRGLSLGGGGLGVSAIGSPFSPRALNKKGIAPSQHTKIRRRWEQMLNCLTEALS